ncbi:hypothetical protein [Palleronia sp. LCG004]|uniref:hypothetical protein n=1 Tax=Palleronia sp. LCG004 TaxID=3079304 RepID=UPI002943C0FD|nr:hypothetical protein [Palleronia sp. LCG004]WOI57170.1 hypothetical protein RVY76_05110 [Palleronia sp. LCG004]
MDGTEAYMQDITELQRRITAALDRIGTGLDGITLMEPTEIAPEENDAGDPHELAEALEAERTLSSQLQERLQANLKKTHRLESDAAGEIDRLKAQLSAIEEDRARLKAVNDALRNSNEALRAANEAGLADEALVGESVRTELDALRQVRASDRAELDAILAILEPAIDRADGQQEETQDA